MAIRRFLCVSAFAVAFGVGLQTTAGPAGAQVRQDAPKLRPTRFLERQLEEGQYFEQYLTKVMYAFRQADLKHDGLDAQDLAIHEQQRDAQQRAYFIAQVLRYDLNGDFVVTSEEVATFRRPNDPTSQNDLDRFDINGDGRVTLKEVIEAGDRISRGNGSRDPDQVSAMLDLPQAQGGRLTAAGLEAAAREIFARADRNGDGLISREEAIQFQQSLPPEPPRRIAEDIYCPMPAVTSRDLILLISAGDRQTASIHVAPGRQPIYLILPSYGAVRWTVTGAAGRVRQAVISSYQRGSGQTPPAVVNGLPPQRVRAFNSRGCVTYFTSPDDEDATEARRAVTIRLGRGPAVVLADDTATEFRVPPAAPDPKASSSN